MTEETRLRHLLDAALICTGPIVQLLCSQDSVHLGRAAYHDVSRAMLTSDSKVADLIDVLGLTAFCETIRPKLDASIADARRETLDLIDLSIQTARGIYADDLPSPTVAQQVRKLTYDEGFYLPSRHTIDDRYQYKSGARSYARRCEVQLQKGRRRPDVSDRELRGWNRRRDGTPADVWQFVFDTHLCQLGDIRDAIAAPASSSPGPTVDLIS